jgi:hypothetical protein
MADPSLEFLGHQLDRVLQELHDVRAENGEMRAYLGRIEHELHEQRQDIGSLGRVMLRFESRLHEIEQHH